MLTGLHFLFACVRSGKPWEKYLKDTFIRLVQMLEVRPNLHAAVSNVSDCIVGEGAMSKECYCVRVFKEDQSWFGDIGSASFPMVPENGIMMLMD